MIRSLLKAGILSLVGGLGIGLLLLLIMIAVVR